MKFTLTRLSRAVFALCPGIMGIFSSLSIGAAEIPNINEPGSHCVSWTKEFLDNPEKQCVEACPQRQAKSFDNYDYINGLKSAFNSFEGLSDFITYTGRSTIIGAPVELQACNLRAVLQFWGDARFSQIMSKHSSETRRQVVNLIEYAGVSSEFREHFPRTYKLKDINKPD